MNKNLFAVVVMALMAASCLRSFDRTHISPLPTPSGYDRLPQKGITVCPLSDEFVSDGVWEYPYEDRPEIDNFDIGSGLRGHQLGVIGACEEVQIYDIRWAPLLGTYMVQIGHHDLKGWIWEGSVCLGDTPVRERKCASHISMAPPTPVPTPKGYDQLPMRGILRCPMYPNWRVDVLQHPTFHSQDVGLLDPCSEVVVEDKNFEVSSETYWVLIRYGELTGWIPTSEVCLDEMEILLRRCPMW